VDYMGEMGEIQDAAAATFLMVTAAAVDEQRT
jgi:hypothetical protein